MLPRPKPIQDGAGDVLLRLRELDGKLQRRGFPPISPWWWATLERFYRSGRRQLVARVGRRGGKSSTLCRVAVAESLYGTHQIPPGDVGMFAFVSVKMIEARERLRTIRDILDAIGEPYTQRGDDVELTNRRVLFRVFTATISGVSGPTCIGAIGDELAKWRDAATGANPATEVLRSLRPTLLTQRSAKMFLSSSPLGMLDAHAEAMALGDTEYQCTATAPSWVANPTVTEEQTHAEEPNEDIWKREYAAIPLEGSEEGMFAASLLSASSRADGKDVPREIGVFYNAAMDPALVRNAWTLAIAGRRWVEGKVRRSIVAFREWRGTSANPLRPDVVLREVAVLLRKYGLDVVDTDEFHGQSLAIIAERPDINIVVRVNPTTSAGKIERYESMLTQMSDGQLELPGDPRVRADLLAVRRLLTPNGFVIRLPETPDGRHCDHASSISLALSKCLVDPEYVGPPRGTPAWHAAQIKAWEAQQEREADGEEQDPWA